MIDTKTVKELMAIEKSVTVRIKCTVIKTESFKSKKGKLITKMKVFDENTERMNILWFANPAISKYTTGSMLIVYGKLIPAIWGKSGLKTPVSMWGKTIKTILLIPEGF